MLSSECLSKAMKSAATLIIATLIFCTQATSETVRSQTTKLWGSKDACWATVWPLVSFMIEEMGSADLVENSDNRIEYAVADMVTGRVVLRAVCLRVPGAAKVFRRYLEFP